MYIIYFLTPFFSWQKSKHHLALKECVERPNSKDHGYFYMRNGNQFYRTREETYQKNQSPRQKWNSDAFAFANAQMAQRYGTPEGKTQLKAEFEAANHIGSNGITYTTAWSWKFNSLQHEYRQSHPFS